MNKHVIAAVLAATALAVPAAATAENGHKRPAKQTEKAKHKRAKKVSFVFRGTFSAPDTVEVGAGNRHARRGGFVGEAVAFDFEDAKIVVADTDGDGERTVADVEDGDRVLVIARLLRGTEYVAPVADEELEEEESLEEEELEDEGPVADAAGDVEPPVEEETAEDEILEDESGESAATEPIAARKLIDRTHPGRKHDRGGKSRRHR